MILYYIKCRKSLEQYNEGKGYSLSHQGFYKVNQKATNHEV